MANMTIDIGAGNPGAVGLKYSSCNEGYLENVVVRSSDPYRRGYRGILGWEEPDCYLKNIAVDGFDIGIYPDASLNGMTLEDIAVKNQSTCGVYIANTVVLRHLTSVNKSPAIKAAEGTTFCVLEFNLSGGAPGGGAIDASADSRGSVFLRQITVRGYGVSAAAPGGTTANRNVIEFAWPAPVSPFNAGSTSLHLPIEETPPAHQLRHPPDAQHRQSPGQQLHRETPVGD